MVGATAELFATLQPVLAQMGRNIVHCGEVGTGQIAKICNNLLLASRWSASAKPWRWAMRWGSTPGAGRDHQQLTGRCWSSDTYNPWPGVIETAPASRGYTGGFGAELMLKDLGWPPKPHARRTSR
jgi:3-hydroxyisobutyrate dehydrogenase